MRFLPNIHVTCGTRADSLCWAVGGANQEYVNMQMVEMETRR